ncbi:MAG: hypothetical protein ACRDS0_24430 [Pseudonocardiaceae bacterium]
MTTSSPPSDPRDQQWRASPPTAIGDQIPVAPTQSLRPLAVDVSFWLWISHLTLDVVLGGVFMLMAGSSGVGSQQLAMFMGALAVDGVLFAFALAMRKGRNWARIVLAVLGGLRLLVLLFVLIVGGSGIFALVLLLVAGAIVTMFIAGANAWFQPRQPGL